MARKKDNDTEVDFEQALLKLDELIKKMEAGSLKLDESLQHFEEGVSLVRQCQQALQVAEQKIHTLIEKNGHMELQVFQSESEQ